MTMTMMMMKKIDDEEEESMMMLMMKRDDNDEEPQPLLCHASSPSLTHPLWSSAHQAELIPAYRATLAKSLSA